jgi:pyruvate formate lyase activating enzyme
MNIGGFQKLSLLDYPNKISAIIWTTGCNLHCPFCYNKELFSKDIELIKEEKILKFLKNRIGKLDALSISGGEPLLQKNLSIFLKKIKKLDYAIKIDTNGTYPKKLKNIIDENLVDYISMDIKAPKIKYNILCGKKVNINNIQKSIDIILNSSKEYEFKTTIIPSLLDKNDLINIAKWIKGADRFYLQQFKNEVSLLSPEYEMIKPYSIEYLNKIHKEIKSYFKKCIIRGI